MDIHLHIYGERGEEEGEAAQLAPAPALATSPASSQKALPSAAAPRSAERGESFFPTILMATCCVFLGISIARYVPKTEPSPAQPAAAKAESVLPEVKEKARKVVEIIFSK